MREAVLWCAVDSTAANKSQVRRVARLHDARQSTVQVAAQVAHERVVVQDFILQSLHP